MSNAEWSHEGLVTVEFSGVRRPQAAIAEVMRAGIDVRSVSIEGNAVTLAFRVADSEVLALHGEGSTRRGRAAALAVVERAMFDDPRGQCQCTHPSWREAPGAAFHPMTELPCDGQECVACGFVARKRERSIV